MFYWVFHHKCKELNACVCVSGHIHQIVNHTVIKRSKTTFLNTFVQVQVAQLFGWILRNRYFAIVEDDPFLVLQDVTNVMTDLR